MKPILSHLDNLTLQELFDLEVIIKDFIEDKMCNPPKPKLVLVKSGRTQ